MQDLRRRVLTLKDLRRRYEALSQSEKNALARGVSSVSFSVAELRTLEDGIPPEEYSALIEEIRKERRSAAPSKAVKTKAKSTPVAIDLESFMSEEHEL